MYNRFFGVTKNPFNMTPDPGCLFLTAQHREALAALSYAILGRKGFVVLTGDAGTGKTTILSRAMQYLPLDRVRSSIILNPTLTPSEFLEMAMLDFGLSDVPASKAQRIALLQKFLLAGHQEGKISALIVDEAHKLSPEVLEEIRLLGNFENADHKLLQVVLVGQSELNQVLDREDLRQFKQRIALRISIEPLLPEEIGRYMRYRWTKAGGVEPPFPLDAIAAIAGPCQGIPRLINVICDNALTIAFSKGASVVNPTHILEACADLHLLGSAAAQPEPSMPLAPAPPAPQSPLPDAPGTVIPDTIAISPFKTLERYNGAGKPSLLGRWAAKLGKTPRIEIA